MALPLSERHGIPVYVASCISELTEGLFRMTHPQGGFFTLDNVLVGLRIGTDKSDYELIHGRTICTFMARDEQPGGSDANTNNSFQKRLRCVKHAKEEKLAIGVVTAVDHRSLVENAIVLPKDEQYAVMGAFMIRDYWIEIRGDQKRTLVACLQKIDDDGIWWNKEEPSEQLDITYDEGACRDCGKPLVQRYTNEDAFCGDPDCPSVRVQNVAKDTKPRVTSRGAVASKKNSSNTANTLPTGAGRKYSSEFLARRVSTTKLPLTPPVPVQLTVDEWKQVFASKGNQRGWTAYVCTICNRFNRRIYWNMLKCRNCGDVLDVKLPDLTLEDLVERQFLDLTDLQTIHDTGELKTQKAYAPQIVDLTACGLDDKYCGFKFNLWQDNYVMILYPKKVSIDMEGGYRDQFNALWELVQKGDIPLARRLLKFNTVDRMLTAHFSKDYGVAYRTAMQLDTTPFDASPQELSEIRAKLSSIVQTVTGTDAGHNEALMIGMYPGQKMNWHSDGENQIDGPIVASVSLGGNAIMRFGLRKEYANGGLKRKNGDLKLLEILPESLKYEDKMKLYQRWENGEMEFDEYEAELKKIVETCHAPDGNVRPLLSFPLLGTGTIMIQHGPTLNKMYKHIVLAQGMARLVVTGRKLKAPGQTEDNKEKVDDESHSEEEEDWHDDEDQAKQEGEQEKKETKKKKKKQPPVPRKGKKRTASQAEEDEDEQGKNKKRHKNQPVARRGTKRTAATANQAEEEEDVPLDELPPPATKKLPPRAVKKGTKRTAAAAPAASPAEGDDAIPQRAEQPRLTMRMTRSAAASSATATTASGNNEKPAAKKRKTAR